MLSLKRKPQKHPINPRIRAYGKARLDIAGRASSAADWNRLWKRPAHPFPFEWGDLWKQCIEYKVDDFAAEVGFYTDILGLEVNALDPGYAMFTGPSGDFYLAIVPAAPGVHSTPNDALRIQFMVSDVLATARELEKRGIPFEQWPQPCAPGAALYVGYFRTPHGICVDVWGLVESGRPATPQTDEPSEVRPGNGGLATEAEPDSEEVQDSFGNETQGKPYPQDRHGQALAGFSDDEDTAVPQTGDLADEDEIGAEGGNFIEDQAVTLFNTPGIDEVEELIEIEYVDEDEL